jgi:hypothetical protein
MYALPDDFDPAVFAATTLAKISFTSNTLVLDFDADISATVESEVRYASRDEHGTSLELAAVPVTHSRLMRLIGRRIVRAEVEGSATLVLHFEGGHALSLIGDNDRYECYQLRIGTREIVV